MKTTTASEPKLHYIKNYDDIYTIIPDDKGTYTITFKGLNVFYEMREVPPLVSLTIIDEMK